MAKLTSILIVLAFLFGPSEMKILGKDNFTSEWTVHMSESLYPPLVTETEDLLIFVSFPFDNTIKLETSRIINKPCEIQSSVLEDNASENVAPLLAETLGNGKIIVSLAEMKSEVNGSNIWFYVIEPVNCTFKVGKFHIEKVIDLDGPDVVTLVPYNETFTFFLKSKVQCRSDKICSLTYSDDLEMIDSKKFVLDYNDLHWDIIPAKDYDPSKGYLHVAIQDESNTTKLELLDANFTTIKSTEVNYSELITYWYSEDRTISLCSSPSNQQIDCIQLDSELGTKFETSVFYDGYIQFFALFNLESGQLVLLTIISEDVSGSDLTGYIQYLDEEGKSSGAVSFYKSIHCYVTSMNAFELKDGLYCITIVCHDSVTIKCISSNKRREF